MSNNMSIKSRPKTTKRMFPPPLHLMNKLDNPMKSVMKQLTTFQGTPHTNSCQSLKPMDSEILKTEGSIPFGQKLKKEDLEEAYVFFIFAYSIKEMQ